MKYLALGPGAMGLFVYLGLLYKMQEEGALDDLEEISGASAGALVGFLFLISNRNLTKALDFALTVPIKQIMKPNIKSLLKEYGLVPLRKVRKFFQEACLKFTNKNDLTFKELYELMPVKFHVAAFCVDVQRTEYFSVDRTPDVSVTEAVCMSIAVPFLFSVSKWNNWHYVDGATAETTPCGPFIGKDRTHVKCVKFAWSRSNEITNLRSYAVSILYSALRMRANYDFPTIDIDLGDADMFDFDAEMESKLRLFMLGQSQQIS